MNRILHHVLETDQEHIELGVPCDAQIIGLIMKGDNPILIVESPTDSGGNRKLVLRLSHSGEFDGGRQRYVGSFPLGARIAHLFEVIG